MSDRIPQHNTTAFLDELRTAQISHLLVAAVIEFDVGRVLSSGAMTFDQLCTAFNLKARPAIVLLTALRSIHLIDVDETGRIGLTDYGREKLDPSSDFHLRGYVGLGGFSADVQNMIAALKNDHPAGDVSFVYHEGGPPSALDDQTTADILTRAMADRARNVAPMLAQQLNLSQSRHLVDVGGGHAIYSLELLKQNSHLTATVIDRAPPLKVAAEYAETAQLSGRIHLQCEDAHSANLPHEADTVLLANLLHDYSAEHAAAMVRHYAAQLPVGGRLMILDSLLNSVAEGAPPVSDGPRPVAAYSALLFSICEGRCYRRDEVDHWLTSSGLELEAGTISLPAHGTLVTGRKVSVAS